MMETGVRKAVRGALGGALAVLFGVATLLAAVGQERKHVSFVPESLRDFAAAYHRERHEALDSRHTDATRYRAYRVAQTGSISGVILARSVSFDAAGNLQITLEPDTVVRGRVTPGSGYAHILLPASAPPPP